MPVHTQEWLREQVAQHSTDRGWADVGRSLASVVPERDGDPPCAAATLAMIMITLLRKQPMARAAQPSWRRAPASPTCLPVSQLLGCKPRKVLHSGVQLQQAGCVKQWQTVPVRGLSPWASAVTADCHLVTARKTYLGREQLPDSVTCQNKVLICGLQLADVDAGAPCHTGLQHRLRLSALWMSERGGHFTRLHRPSFCRGLQHAGVQIRRGISLRAHFPSSCELHKVDAAAQDCEHSFLHCYLSAHTSAMEDRK